MNQATCICCHKPVTVQEQIIPVGDTVRTYKQVTCWNGACGLCGQTLYITDRYNLLTLLREGYLTQAQYDDAVAKGGAA